MTVALIVDAALIVLVSVAAIVTGTIAVVLIVVGHVGKGVVMSRMWN